MSALLRWKGNELRLGATKMAEVIQVATRGSGAYDGVTFRYVLGPEDFVSEPYQEKDDARQDCEAHVRRLLKRAGVADA